MKRTALVLLGIAWGLFVTWLSIRVENQIDWPSSPSHSTGCNDLEHCMPHTQFLIGLIASLSWPAIVCGCLNGLAYRRWPTRRWGAALGIVTVIAALFYLAPDLVRASGPLFRR